VHEPTFPNIPGEDPGPWSGRLQRPMSPISLASRDAVRMVGSSRELLFCCRYCYSLDSEMSYGCWPCFYRRGCTSCPVLSYSNASCVFFHYAPRSESQFALTESPVLLSRHTQRASAARNVAKAPSKLPGEARPPRTWPWRLAPLCLPPR
jgi:hypothetical protein